MFVSFVVVITIVISNMLIGLAVDDIKAVQDNAILRRQALTVQLTLDSWYKIPNKWRYNRVDHDRDNTIAIGGKKLFTLSRFMSWIDPDTKITRSMVSANVYCGVVIELHLAQRASACGS